MPQWLRYRFMEACIFVCGILTIAPSVAAAFTNSAEVTFLSHLTVHNVLLPSIQFA